MTVSGDHRLRDIQRQPAINIFSAWGSIKRASPQMMSDDISTNKCKILKFSWRVAIVSLLLLFWRFLEWNRNFIIYKYLLEQNNGLNIWFHTWLGCTFHPYGAWLTGVSVAKGLAKSFKVETIQQLCRAMLMFFGHRQISLKLPSVEKDLTLGFQC